MARKSRYTIGRPSQEVRLRQWPAGRAAQFKKAIELLEIQLNQTMAAQVNQGDKRILSPRVPKVTGVSVRSGFKNFQINFLEAKGITDLLFYEIQKDNVQNFAAPTVYKIPQTSLTIPTENEREIVYFRVRCVNSSFEVGPWSATVRGTGSSNFRIAITRTSSSEAFIGEDDHDEWTDVGVVIYQATAANVSLHLHAGIHAIARAYFPTTAGGPNIDHNVDPTIAIRILKDGDVLSTGRMTLNTVGIASRTSGPTQFFRSEAVTVGTMVTKFETFIGDEGTITYTIQAKVLSDSFAWKSTGSPIETYLDDVGIIIDAIDLLEVIAGS